MVYPHGASCAGYQHPGPYAPYHCPRPVVAAGLVFYEERRGQFLYLAFACPEHTRELIAARPLQERDHAEITRRRTRPATERTEPLAVGREARELVARARRWARTHPERLYRPPAEPLLPLPPHIPDRPIGGYGRSGPG
jgi:hypothetical protein